VSEFLKDNSDAGHGGTAAPGWEFRVSGMKRKRPPGLHPAALGIANGNGSQR